jgi:hypothetical protein
VVSGSKDAIQRSTMVLIQSSLQRIEVKDRGRVKVKGKRRRSEHIVVI